MPKLLAEVVVTVVVLTLFAALIAGGILDLVLYLTDQPTITDYLREHPLWFWIPVAIVLVFIALLGIHLFLEPFLPADF